MTSSKSSKPYQVGLASLAIVVGGLATALLSLDRTSRVEGYAVPIGLAVSVAVALLTLGPSLVPARTSDLQQRSGIPLLLMIGAGFAAVCSALAVADLPELPENVIVATSLSATMMLGAMAVGRGAN